ncbi:MAG: cytochrome c [Nitrospinota bacterium]
MESSLFFVERGSSMPIRITSYGIIAGAIALFMFSGVSKAGRDKPESPEEIQKNRTLTMKTIDKAMRRIRVLASKGQWNQLAATAKDISGLITRIPELSPEGSGFGEKSRIKPEVWLNFSEYEELSIKSSSAALNLAKLAEGGDSGVMMRSFVDLAKTCRACHKPFRKKKKKRRK